MNKKSKQIQKDVFSKDFRTFFEKNIKSKLHKIEKTRVYCLSAIVFICIINALLLLAVILFFNGIIINSYVSSEFPFYIIIIMVAVSFSASILVTWYKDKAKKAILPVLLSYIGNLELIDSNDGKKSVDRYVSRLRLFPYYNRFYCDDYLKGTYNDVDLEIAELTLKKITHSGKKVRVYLIFKGIFIKYKSMKKFNGYTVITKDSLKIGHNPNHVHLEDPEFEKIFDVTGSDQIESRYLITPSFMRRLVELSKKYGNIVVSFEYGYINIGISSSRKHPGIPLFKSVYNIAYYRGIILEIVDVFSVLDKLKLDQNIGL